MSEQQDRRVMQRYAAASAALDEAPSAATRAAILAAAARAAGARPQPMARVRRWRLPLAAAASVLVGTIAVLLATRIDESSPVVPAPAPPAATVAAAPPAAEPTTRSRVAEAPPPAPALADVRTPKVGAAPPNRAALRPAAPLEPVQEAGRADSRPAAAAVERDATTAASDGATGAAPAQPAESAEARSLPAPQAARRFNEQAADARLEAKAELAVQTPWRATTEQWIEHIVKLRTEGRHDEADAELALLRKRYADLRLPPSALATPGR